MCCFIIFLPETEEGPSVFLHKEGQPNSLCLRNKDFWPQAANLGKIHRPKRSKRMNSVKNKKKYIAPLWCWRIPMHPTNFLHMYSLSHLAVKSGHLRGQAGNSTKGVGSGATGLTVVELGRGPSLPRALADAHLPSLGFESDLPQWEAAGGLF